MRRISPLAFTAVLATAAPARADIVTPVSEFAKPALTLFFFGLTVIVLARLLLLVLRFLRRRGRGAVALASAGQSAFPPSDFGTVRRFWKEVAVVAAMSLALFLATYVPYRYSRSQRRGGPEHKSNLGAIRSVQVAYFAEWNSYVGNVPPTPLADRRGHPEKVKWDPTTRFSILGFAPEGKVYCSYALEGPAFSTEGFTARAECDLDGDGRISVWTITNASTDVTHSGAPF